MLYVVVYNYNKNDERTMNERTDLAASWNTLFNLDGFLGVLHSRRGRLIGCAHNCPIDIRVTGAFNSKTTSWRIISLN